MFDLVPGFDQEAAATVITRLAISKCEVEEPLEVIRWIDRLLIRVAAKFGTFKREDTSSFRLPEEF